MNKQRAQRQLMCVSSWANFCQRIHLFMHSFILFLVKHQFGDGLLAVMQLCLQCIINMALLPCRLHGSKIYATDIRFRADLSLKVKVTIHCRSWNIWRITANNFRSMLWENVRGTGESCWDKHTFAGLATLIQWWAQCLYTSMFGCSPRRLGLHCMVNPTSLQ